MPNACLAIAVVEVLLNAHQQIHQDRMDAGGDSRTLSEENWLAITPDEAAALIHVAQDPAVAAVDVAPARAMPLTEVLGLVARLFDSLLRVRSPTP